MVSTLTCVALTIFHSKRSARSCASEEITGASTEKPQDVVTAAVEVKASALMQTDCCCTKPGHEGMT